MHGTGKGKGSMKSVTEVNRDGDDDRQKRRADRLKLIRERAARLADYDPFEYTQLRKRASGFRSVRDLADMPTMAALLACAFLFSSPCDVNCFGAELKRTDPITCPAGVDGKPPAEPFITRHDYRAVKFDQPPGPGLREDLRMRGETWPGVKFGPMRTRRDGGKEIFVSAHRSAWVAAAELPECVRARFGINAK
jgi:hypothetical protein